MKTLSDTTVSNFLDALGLRSTLSTPVANRVIDALVDLDNPEASALAREIEHVRAVRREERRIDGLVEKAKTATISPLKRRMMERIDIEEGVYRTNTAHETRTINELQSDEWITYNAARHGYTLTRVGRAALDADRARSATPPEPKLKPLPITDVHRANLNTFYATYRRSGDDPLATFTMAFSLSRIRLNALVARGLLEKNGNWDYRFTKAGLAEIQVKV